MKINSWLIYPFPAASSVILFLTLSIALTACQSGDSSSEALQDGAIDPTALNEWTTEIAYIVSESDDFMPGRLTNMFVLSNGHFVVYDQASNELHQFSDSGQWLARIAAGGSGPGELEQFSQIRKTNTGVLVNNISGKVQLYEPDENGLLRFETDFVLEAEDKRVNIMARPTNDTYLASEQVRITPQPNSRPEDIFPEFSKATMMLIHEDGRIISDSLFTRHAHNGYMHMADNGGIFMYSLPYRFTDSITMTSDGKTILGRADTGEILVFDESGKQIHTTSGKIKSRPVNDDIVQDAIERIPSDQRRNAMERMKAEQPTFQSAILDDENRFWLHTETTKTDQEYVVIDYNGNPLATVRLPLESRLAAVSRNILYLRHVPDDDLHEIHLLRLNI